MKEGKQIPGEAKGLKHWNVKYGDKLHNSPSHSYLTLCNF